MTQADGAQLGQARLRPAEFTLVAAGGAGPLFACDIALELEILRVLVPRTRASRRRRASSPPTSCTSSSRRPCTPLRALDRQRLAAHLRRPRGAGGSRSSPRRLRGRARGRNALRRLPLRRPGLRGAVRGPAGAIDDDWVVKAAEGFHAAHEREYGHRFEAEIDIVNVRVAGVGLVPPLVWPEIEPSDDPPAPKFEREVVFEIDGRPQSVATPFYDRSGLRAGQSIMGPAIWSSTTRRR